MEPDENDNFAKTYQSMPQNVFENAPLAPSEEAQMNFSEYLKLVDQNEENVQPMCVENTESEAYKIMAPITKRNWEEETRSVASENMGSSSAAVGNEVNKDFQCVPLAPLEAQMTFGEYLKLVNQNEENVQPMCITNTESETYKIMSPITKRNWERETWSFASENMGSSSTAAGNEVNLDFPSTIKQQSNMMLENDPGNINIASHHLGVNPIVLDQNLGQDVNASSANPQPEMQQEYEEQRKRVDNLRAKNNVLKEKLERLSEECLDLSNENNSLEYQKELAEKYGAEITEILANFDSSPPYFFPDGGDDES